MSYNLRATSHELRATSYELRATSHELRATSQVLQATSYKLRAPWRAAALTVLRGVDRGRAAVGPLPFGIEGFDLHVELGVGRDGGVLVGVAPLLRVGHHHLPPLGAVVGLEGDDVAKVLAVVVLRFHGLKGDTGGTGVRAQVTANGHKQTSWLTAKGCGEREGGSRGKCMN